MIKRTTQTHLSTLTFPSGNTFSLPIPYSPNSSTELKFAVGSSADTGLHWHEQHTEYFEVIQGVGRITLENQNGFLETRFVSKSSGVVTIPRYRRHCLGRGDGGISSITSITGVNMIGGSKPETADWKLDLLVREWTDPRDGKKEAFFRNLAGVVHDAASWPWKGQVGRWLGNRWTEWQVLVIFGALDNYPAVLGGRWKGMEWVIVHVLCLILGVLGRLVGLRGEYDEYTPLELRGGEGNVRRKSQ